MITEEHEYTVAAEIATMQLRRYGIDFPAVAARRDREARALLLANLEADLRANLPGPAADQAIARVRLLEDR